MKQKGKSDFDRMRDEVLELELKARFWKANFEIKEYSIKNREISEKYDEFVRLEQEAYAKAMQDFETQYKDESEKVPTAESPIITTVSE